MTLEAPWHVWKPTSEHSIRIRNLVDINQMTTAWLKDLEMEENQGPYHLRRVFSPGAKDSLDMLERLTRAAVPTHINAILNDLGPDEFVARLEAVILSAQAWSLSKIFQNTPESERAALKNELIRSSFQTGRDAAQKRWPKLPTGAQNNLRSVYSAIRECPFAGYPHSRNLLLRRGLEKSLEFELLQCPHRSELPEVRLISDDLCLYQSHWLRGFVYTINTQIEVNYFKQSAENKHHNCMIRWALPS